MSVKLSERIDREQMHGKVILESNESNWGWSTPAGSLRKKRRADFLTSDGSTTSLESNVLEVGCGTGTFSGDIYKKFTHLTAIDIADDLIAEARKKFPQINFMRDDIHKTAFADNSFDMVLGCSVLHHLEWDIALKEIMRLLKCGGELRFCEPNLFNPQIFIQKNWGWLKRKMGDSPDEYAFTANQIRKSLIKAGFHEITVKPFEFLHPATPSVLIDSVIKIEGFLEKTCLKNLSGSLKIIAKKPKSVEL